MSLVRTEALIMKGMDLGEADRIVTAFTRKKGKVRMVAGGVRRTRSSMAALVQPFTYSSLVIYSTSSLGRLRHGEIIESFAGLREDLVSMASASYLMELVDFLLGEEDPQEGVFTLLLNTLQLFKEVGPRVLAIRTFELRLMAILGYSPHLDSCVVCGADYENKAFFSSNQGGIICSNCSGGGKIPVSLGSVRLMNELLTKPLRKLLNIRLDGLMEEEMERIMTDYILYHTERELKSLSFLRSLKSFNP